MAAKLRISVILLIGMIMVSVCALSGCGAEAAEDPVHGHAFGEWEEATAPTCEGNGARRRVCACGAEERETIEPLGHDAGGEKDCESVKCKRCGAELAPGVHQYGEWAVTAPAQCKIYGERRRACDICGKSQREDIPPSHRAGAEATCVTPQKCRVCGDILAEALGHRFAGWETVNGEEVRQCERCGERETRTPGLRYEKKGSGWQVVAWVPAADVKKIIVPEIYEGLPVTAVGERVFAATAIESVELGDRVLSIGREAFADCAALTTVVAKGAEIVEERAFSACAALREAVMPKLKEVGRAAFAGDVKLTAWTKGEPELRQIGGEAFAETGLKNVALSQEFGEFSPSAFAQMNALEAISVQGGNARYFADQGILYDRISTGALFCPRVKQGTVVLPEGTKRVEAEAFAGCRVTEIEGLENVEYIGERAFFNAAITAVDFGARLTEIGSRAFSGCPLRKVAIPAATRSVGAGAFAVCRRLEHMTLASADARWGSGAFVKTALTEIRLECRLAEAPALTIAERSVWEEVRIVVPREFADFYAADPFWQNLNVTIEEPETPDCPLPNT